MTVVYLLFVEDPGDEYYEEKFHSAFLTFEEAETFVNNLPHILNDGHYLGYWTIKEVPLCPETPKSERRFPVYTCVSKKDKL